ncbi:MAG: CvpA family protein [Pseudomonadota bacterium]|jgi:membrane protein required for colicin V production
MTAFDYMVLAVVGASVLLGAWRGLFSEVLALAAWIVAFVAARTFAGDAAPLLGAWIKEGALQYLVAFVVIFVGVILLAALLRLAVSKLLRAVGLGPLDRFLGAVFGVLRGAVVVLVAVLAAGFTALPQQAWWRDAYFSPPLETAVLAAKPWFPPAVAKRIKYR